MRRGWTVDVFERVESELAGRGAGIVAQTELIARHDSARARYQRSRRARQDAQTPRYRRPRDAVARMPAGAHRLGARLPLAARCLSGRTLSPWPRPERLRAERRGRHCALGRRRHRRGRRAGRRRRPALHGARPLPAGRRPALCRLLRLARAASRERNPAGHPSPAVRVDDVLPAARRTMPVLSGRRTERRSAPRPPPLQRRLVSAGRRSARASLSAHRRQRRDPFDLDPATAHPPRSHRPPCARRRSDCCRRNSAPSSV